MESNVDGKILPLFKKSGSTIIAIDAPAHGLSGGKEFNIPQYAAYIDILAQIKTSYLIGHSIGGKTVCTTNLFIKII
jgi:pimeloyl-ACP methyl ester carboxylesterase